MRHLGDLVAAYVDDQLDDAGRQRAADHLSRCGQCREEVALERRAKAQLSALGEPPVPGDLSARLLDLPVRRDRPGPVGFRGRAGARRPRLRADSRRPGSRGEHHRLRMAVAGAASVVLSSLGVALIVGASTQDGPTVTPAVDRYLYEHAAVSNEVPLVDPGMAAVSVSYAGVAGP